MTLDIEWQLSFASLTNCCRLITLSPFANADLPPARPLPARPYEQVPLPLRIAGSGIRSSHFLWTNNAPITFCKKSTGPSGALSSPECPVPALSTDAANVDTRS